MKRYVGRKGALFAMIVFFVLAAVFFALGIAFFRAVGGVFFALWLFSLLGIIGSASRFFPERTKKKRVKKEQKSDTLEEILFYDAVDDDF